MILLFIVFLYIGVFSVGGGLSAIPLIQETLITRLGWITPEVLGDVVAIAEMTPGPLSVNLAAFIGMRLHGVHGAILATAACVFPGCLISFGWYQLNHYFLGTEIGGTQKKRRARLWLAGVEALRASVTGTIAYGGLTVARDALFPAGGTSLLALLCFFIALFFTVQKKANPVACILIVGLGGGFLELGLERFF